MTQVHAMSDAARIEFLEAQIAKMRADSQRKLSMKVTAKKADGTGTDGAISLYGLGRFPITLYAGQWERVIEHIKSGALERFIETNSALLSRKD